MQRAMNIVTASRNGARGVSHAQLRANPKRPAGISAKRGLLEQGKLPLRCSQEDLD